MGWWWGDSHEINLVSNANGLSLSGEHALSVMRKGIIHCPHFLPGEQSGNSVVILESGVSKLVGAEGFFNLALMVLISTHLPTAAELQGNQNIHV